VTIPKPVKAEKAKPARIRRSAPIARSSKPIKRKAVRNASLSAARGQAGKADKPLRRARISKHRRSSLAALKRKLWKLFAAYVKERDGNTCFSCGRGGLAGSNWHAGHLFPAGSSSLIRWEPKNVHSQCYHDNINLGGAGAAYAVRFIERYGIDEFNRLSALSREMKAWKPYEIEALIAAIKRSGADYEMAYAELYGLLPAVLHTGSDIPKEEGCCTR